MEEKRKFNRLSVEKGKKILVEFNRNNEKVSLINISATGMKANFSRYLEIGTVIYATIPVLSAANLYYVKGNVIRIEKKEDIYETSIKFEVVSTRPLTK